MRKTRFWLPLACSLLLAPRLPAANRTKGINPGGLTATGVHEVSLTNGSFINSLSLDVPPGRAGLQPDLTVLYNSSNDAGWLGLGMSLELGSIVLSTKNGVPALNPETDPVLVNFAGQSRELLLGQTGQDGFGSYRQFSSKIHQDFMRFRY